MEIKQYDIIEYEGELCRVMGISMPNNIKISPYGWVDIKSTKLIESVDVPTLDVGDCVSIHGIDPNDEDEYSAAWVEGMDEFVQTTATVEGVDTNIGICKLSNGFWFAPYHLEKITYDMI